VKVSVEKLPSSEAVVEVDFSWDELEKASDKAYRKLVQKVDVQGFRRGKAPRSLLERKLGKEYIYQEGLDDLITETYRNAVKEHDLTPISQPELDAPILQIGQPYHFSLKVPILSPVELGSIVRFTWSVRMLMSLPRRSSRSLSLGAIARRHGIRANSPLPLAIASQWT
jgi:trigger factor